jgi:hypothetical protein
LVCVGIMGFSCTELDPGYVNKIFDQIENQQWHGNGHNHESINSTDTLFPEKDTYVRSDLTVRSNDNYGLGDVLVVGNHRESIGPLDKDESIGPFDKYAPDGIRSLLYFPVKRGSALVKKATLTMTLYKIWSFAPPQNYIVTVHRIIPSGSRTPWVEGNGCERNIGDLNPENAQTVDLASGVAWIGNGDGGDPNNITQPDFDPQALGTLQVSDLENSNEERVEIDVTELVNMWLSGKAENEGLLLKDSSLNNDSFKHLFFYSKDQMLPENVQKKPCLVIEY